MVSLYSLNYCGLASNPRCILLYCLNTWFKVHSQSNVMNVRKSNIVINLYQIIWMFFSPRKWITIQVYREVYIEINCTLAKNIACITCLRLQNFIMESRMLLLSSYTKISNKGLLRIVKDIEFGEEEEVCFTIKSQ